MKFSELATFIQVVEAGGMTQAAALRGVSQPAISRAIRDIERGLQAQLLRRTGRGVELTPAGERFLAFARETVEGYERARHEVSLLADSPPPELSIVVPLNTGRLLIPALLKRFATALPELNVHLYEDASARMIGGVATATYDIAVIYAPPAPSSQITDRLFQEQLYLVGPETLTGPNDRPIPLAEVARLPLLLPGTASVYRQFIAEAFARSGLTPNIARELETAEALLAFAMEGDGVAILPYSNIFREHESGEVGARQIIRPALERHVCLAISRHLHAETAAGARRVLRDGLRALAPTARWRISD